MMMRPLFRVLSPAGARARLSILIFHRVLPVADPLFPEEIHAAQFDALCGWLKRWFHVMALDQAAGQLAEGTLPERALCITFDDGYADNHDVAMPILQRHGLCATFFVATGFLDGGRMWNDSLVELIRRAPKEQLDLKGLDLPLAEQGDGSLDLHSIPLRRQAINALIGAIKYRPLAERVQLGEQLAARAEVRLPNDLMMASSQVLGLRQGGMQIGAHTVSHPILATMDRESQRAEILAGKQRLEQVLDEAVTLFAYPNGKPGQDYNAVSVELTRELGFKAAVSTSWGAARSGTDLLELPRFTPWDRKQLPFAARMAHNLWAR